MHFYKTRDFGAILAAMTVLLALSGCPNRGEKPMSGIEVDRSNLNFGHETTTLRIQITTDTTGDEWKVVSESDWLVFDPSAGTGSGTVTVTVDRGEVLIGTYTGELIIDADDRDISVPVWMEKTASGNTTQIYSNVLDPHLIRSQLTDGTTVDFYGERDADGLPIQVTDARVQFVDGETVRFQFDEQGRIQSILAKDDTVFSWNWVSDIRAAVTITSGDGSAQVSTILDPSNVGEPVVQNLVEPSALISHTTPRGEATWLPQYVGIRGRVFSAKEETDASLSTVTLTNCDSTLINGKVEFVVEEPGGDVRTIPATYQGDGVYAALLSLETNELEMEVGLWCSTIEVLLEPVCNGLVSGGDMLITERVRENLSLIEGVDPRLVAQCDSIVLASAAYCSVLVPVDAENFPETSGLCEGIEAIVNDPIPVNSRVSARAITPGIASIITRAVYLTHDEPVVHLFDGTDGLPQIADFFAEPADPKPFENYLVTVQFGCMPADTRVTMSIRGTDGYADSRTCIVVDSGECRMAVPGTSEGVIDYVDVVFENGLSRTIVLVF
jgi:YD repeat-containing protein